MEKNQILILTTGGTIEKSYSEYDGSLKNRQSMLKKNLLSKLRLPYLEVHLKEIMSKDSLEMTDADRELIWQTIKENYEELRIPIIILHGTDTMELTARYCFEKQPEPPVPVVFTGAMSPMGFAESDATQNFVEALALSQVIPSGFYISFHSHLFKVPNVKKNKLRRTFEVT